MKNHCDLHYSCGIVLGMKKSLLYKPIQTVDASTRKGWGVLANPFIIHGFLLEGSMSIRDEDRSLRINSAGYVLRSDHKRVHRLVAEKALGKKLPLGSIVHHHNGYPGDNRPCNFVLCENQAYHNLLEMRTRAYRACGDANWRKCTYCQEYDSLKFLHVPLCGWPIYHHSCRNEYRRGLRNARKKKVSKCLI